MPDDSQSADITDGGIAAAHPYVPPQFYVAPTTGADDFNTLRPSIVPTACWRMDQNRFAFDSSFIGPSATNEFALLVARRSPSDPTSGLLSVFGHADSTGKDDYNKTLSGRRATAVYGVLVRDVSLWENLYSSPFGGDKWGTRQIQTMLDALGYDPGAIDGETGPKTDAAARNFQAENGLAVDGVVGHNTRAKLFAVYMDFLCSDSSGKPFQYAPTDFLGLGADEDGKAAYQGCSDFNPVLIPSKRRLAFLEQPENHPERDVANRVNRRVVVYIFPAGLRFKLDKWPCPRATEGDDACKSSFWQNGDDRRAATKHQRENALFEGTFACRFYDSIARFSPCEAARRSLTVWLLDSDHKRMPGAPFRASLGAQTVKGIADESGRALILDFFAGPACVLEWGVPAGASDGGLVYRYSTHLLLDFSTEDDDDSPDSSPDSSDQDDDTQAVIRLVNLGYSPNNTLAENISEFQLDYGLASKAWPDPDTKTALWQAHASGTEGTLEIPIGGDVDPAYTPLGILDDLAPWDPDAEDPEDRLERRTDWFILATDPSKDDDGSGSPSSQSPASASDGTPPSTPGGGGTPPSNPSPGSGNT